MFALGRRSSQRAVNIWPGFVDGLASLLLVVVFVLMVFVVAQFFLSAALTGRDEALAQLERRVGELSELLSLERDANAELRLDVTQLSNELQSSVAEREQLESRLAALADERDSLRQKLAAARDNAREEAREIRQAYETIEADKEMIRSQLDQLSILKSLREELRDEVARLETRLAAARRLAEQRKDELAELDKTLQQVRLSAEERRKRIAKLQGELEDAEATARERKETITALRGDLASQAERAETLKSELSSEETRARSLEAQVEQTSSKLRDQQKLTDEQEAKIDVLNSQLASLRRQVAKLNAALDAAEAENEAKAVKIANLGERLNVALANKVQELARYRSEFFGRLRKVLGDRRDIRVVGDRFVFQSEVLFSSASADLGNAGGESIRQLADTLKQIMAEMPEDIDWILRVDGHTDSRPIDTPRFPSNWELSTARAVEVVKFLIDEGIPPHRLAATGFGPYQPIDSGADEIAHRRNRRIEFKLTQQ